MYIRCCVLFMGLSALFLSTTVGFLAIVSLIGGGDLVAVGFGGSAVGAIVALCVGACVWVLSCCLSKMLALLALDAK